MTFDAVFQVLAGKAVLVEHGVELVWLPLSQVTCALPLQSLRRGDEVTVTIPQWLAEKKGLRACR